MRHVRYSTSLHLALFGCLLKQPDKIECRVEALMALKPSRSHLEMFQITNFDIKFSTSKSIYVYIYIIESLFYCLFNALGALLKQVSHPLPFFAFFFTLYVLLRLLNCVQVIDLFNKSKFFSKQRVIKINKCTGLSSALEIMVTLGHQESLLTDKLDETHPF